MNKKNIKETSTYLNYFQTIFEIFKTNTLENNRELTNNNNKSNNSNKISKEINTYINDFISNKLK